MMTVRGRLFVAVVLAALLSGILSAPASSSEDETSAGFETVLRGTNDYRQLNGVDRLVHDPRMSAVAQAWAERMAADYASTRDFDVAFRHNPLMSQQVPAGWESVGENIALNRDTLDPYEHLLTQWRDSAGHNANMLNSRWTHIGIGTFQDDLGITWGVQVFGDYGSPVAIPDPADAVVDLDSIPSSGTVACVALVMGPSGSEFFRQCGTRAGNVYTFSDVPPGSYSIKLLDSGGGVLYSGWPSGGGAFTVSSGIQASLPAGTTRLYGANRYDTAVQVSRQYAPGVPAVFVAAGTGFPDALSAAAAAAHLGGPLLLTSTGSIPSHVVTEIRRLDPAQIYIAGGTGAVSLSVYQTLATIAPVTRYGGADRYATGLQISRGSFTRSTTAIIATGRAFPDALAATGVAGKLNAPVILVDGLKSSVSSQTLSELSRLGVTKVIIAGGTGAVSAGIKNQLTTRGYSVTRYGGGDRYSTAALINNAYFPAGSSGTIILANGVNFPDGLTGAALAGHLGAPLYTTSPTCAPKPIHDSVVALRSTSAIVLGGTAVLSNAAAANVSCG
ncbi:cell wall-binding repeat-containing protein [Demequina sp.]|uniref:cell wall-binding repeat-containing protein n=1 Tax=Demequina sp. TaxID=2050685 RepID=UPI0025BE8594|nr:cell wall-binding repeat-containing protein [Demequina sp.]